MTDYYFLPAPITTPIALSRTNSATITLPWFVQATRKGPKDEKGLAEFPPMPTTYLPLINGEAAFGAVYDAIFEAKSCVDIICWGFQPSMYFRRGSGAPCIGDLLIKKAIEGVKVRVLSWKDAPPLSQYTENNLPGYSVARLAFTHDEKRDSLNYDGHWFYAINHGIDVLNQTKDNPLVQSDTHNVLDFSAFLRTLDPASAIRTLQNIQFVTRGFSKDDGNEIYTRETAYRADKQLDDAAITAFQYFPTHHQKTVVVDYDMPDRSLGFVMGHNMLDAYWDTDAHSYLRLAPDAGRNGATPRQDMSCKITGRLLEHLNYNFCRAWQRSTDENLLAARMFLGPLHELRRKEGFPVMAQITRTQSQEGRRDIKTMYLQAVNNATNFIYIENQYFRWPPLADMIKEAAKEQLTWGRDPGQHGSIYLFVVTNADDDALFQGDLSTYRMLEGLGQANAMPTVTRLERGEALQAQRNKAQGQYDLWKTDTTIMDKFTQHAKATQARLSALQQQLDDLDQQIKNNNDANQALLPLDIPGLKVLICTLVAPDGPTPWINTYVHSKIMVVDDVFLTHGSANINTRSMEVDSEINICHEHGDVTRPVREHLWDIHTKGMGVGQNEKNSNRLDAADAYDQWVSIIKTNKSRHAKTDTTLTPYAPLIAFYRDSATRGRRD
ncbi:phospholipase D-like domain-containing protein [Dyella caseinilytica]|uniref:phospholipase D-like domain-containing protein n=1 Tax=Dyella caseinilytica TaxID=1849581 RepID=UPI00193F8DB7|nr:phospholipase D-like domain-containing protein [Dyella caseinilytica]GGA09964.1 phospholipase [Dyella caseinilytica]